MVESLRRTPRDTKRTDGKTLLPATCPDLLPRGALWCGWLFGSPSDLARHSVVVSVALPLPSPRPVHLGLAEVDLSWKADVKSLPYSRATDSSSHIAGVFAVMRKEWNFNDPSSELALPVPLRATPCHSVPLRAGDIP